MSHSHSCGPAAPLGLTIPPDDWLVDDIPTMPWPMDGRGVDMLKLFCNPSAEDGLGRETKPLEDPTDRGASFELVEFAGLSISIESFWPALLLPRLCRFDVAELLLPAREVEAAPGPGAFLGGAAAIGTTPLPPTAPVPEPA